MAQITPEMKLAMFDDLRQQLAVLQINNTKFLEISVENEQLKQQLAAREEELGSPPTDFHLLKQQLAECERDLADMKDLWGEMIERYKGYKEQLATVTAERNSFQDQCISLKMKMTVMREERDELVAALKKINNVALGHPYAGVTCGELARAALAKVGADKTGEV